MAPLLDHLSISIVVDFYAAMWLDFTPPLTKYLVEKEEVADGGDKGDELGTYQLWFIDPDGILEDELIDEGTFDGTTYGVGGTVTLSGTGSEVFNKVILGAADGTDTGLGTSDYVIASLYYEQNDDSITEVTHTYPVTITAGLVDVDGSEVLSDVTLSGVPEGTVFYVDAEGTVEIGTIDPVPDGDGFYTWSFTPAEYAPNGETPTAFYMTILGETEGGVEITSFDLTASVTATEENGDAMDASLMATTTAVDDVEVPDLDVVLGDIKRDNGFGNGDDETPGGSGGNNNAENAIEIDTGTSGNDIMFGTHTVQGEGEGEFDGEYALQDFIDGGNGDDVIYGEAQLDASIPEDGLTDDTVSNDYLEGGSGDDKLYGGGGDDYLVGGDDDDELYGGAGDDDMFGGEGHDQFIFAANFDLASEEDSIDGGAGGSWIDEIDLSALVDGSSLVYGVDWVVTLDSGAMVPAPVNDEIDLGADEAGIITFTGEAGSITFENVEKIVW